jgi:hypothetical protein
MRIGDRTLPVRRLKERIIDKIKLNRVTLICGFTGSGILPSALSLFFSCLFLSLSLSLFWFHFVPRFDLFCESVRWKKEHETRQYVLVFLIWIFLAGFVNVEERLFRFREILALYANMLSQDFPSLDLSVFCGVYEEVLEDVLVSSVRTPAATT